MSLVLDTGVMKYRKNPNQPWRPLVIKAGMNWESMADTYDPDNGTYEVGQYVLEEGMMYRCISEITTPEAWTPAHWTSVNVGDELSSFIIISDDQPTDETNKIWIAETTAPFGVQIPTMDDHNALGNTLNHLEDGLAIIVNGDTCSTAVPIGGYAYIKNNTHGLAEGLYTNTSASAFPTSGGTANSSVFTIVSDGGLNSLKDSFTEIIDISSQFTINTTSGSGHISAFYNPASGVVRISGNYYSPQTVAYSYSFCSVASAYRPSTTCSIPTYVIMYDNTPSAQQVVVRADNEGMMMLAGQWKYVYFSGVYKL